MEKVSLCCRTCLQAMREKRLPEPCAHVVWWLPQDFEYAFREKLVSRHPQLFGDDPKASPLSVEVVVDRKDEMAGLIITELLTLAISPLILPSYPVTSPFELDLCVRDDSGETLYGKAATVKGQEKTWLTLFTPFGLIPIPGPSDVPKKSVTIIEATKTVPWGDHILEVLTDMLAAEVLKLDPAKLPVRRPKPGAVREVPLPDTFQLPNF
ncbi:MAG: hypothetical protein RBT78_07070 [Kiritimatiellia bacterium]|nr:hypothetical protein [Kiritimatiellia bacterium]